ncbi:MAG TPA: hypothetical protein VMU16_02925 [Candidatus Binataceae bacterium]|nr:hypothetical protein [Candidatus Binataceae bacterium]
MTSKTKSPTSYLAYLPNFSDGEDAFLLLIDDDSVRWLMGNFDRLAYTPFGSACDEFTIGDGQSIDSDEMCLLKVELLNHGIGTNIVRTSATSFRWSVARGSAHHFSELLSGMVDCTNGHNYLNSDDRDSPVVVISRGEYEVEKVRQWAAESHQR